MMDQKIQDESGNEEVVPYENEEHINIDRQAEKQLLRKIDVRCYTIPRLNFD